MEHLATAAREYHKYAIRKDPTTAAKPIPDPSTADENLSEEDRGRMERKRARRLAQMCPEVRESWLRAEATGVLLPLI